MITRRRLITGLLGGMAAGTLRGQSIRVEPHDAQDVVRIAFGSCASQRKDQTVWRQVAARDPHLFIMMGDGVYPEHEPGPLPTVEAIRSAYRHAGTRSELQRFRDSVPVAAIWDDNDYGGSDIGRTFQHKLDSRDLFLDFWASASEASMRRRDSGIYASWELGVPERRIQIIVPDLRFSRSEWAQTEGDVRAARGRAGLGPYKPAPGGEVTMLGEPQWAWLENCLRRPAGLRLFVSSIQLVPEDRGWESWSNFPSEKQRLLELFASHASAPIVVLSGDVHYAEISRQNGSDGFGPLWEFTSSGLTEFWPTPGPNAHRVGPAYAEPNFGMLSVDWRRDSPRLSVEILAADGRLLRRETLLLPSLLPAGQVSAEIASLHRSGPTTS